MTEATITMEDYQAPNTENIIKIANVSGQLDESNVDEKIKEIYKVLEQIPTGLKLVLNLENLNYMNSKSIGYVTDLYGKITKGSGLVVIASAKANIIDILQVVGLTQLLKTFDSLDDAKKYFLSIDIEIPTSTKGSSEENIILFSILLILYFNIW